MSKGTVMGANALLRPDWSEAALAEWGRYL